MDNFSKNDDDIDFFPTKYWHALPDARVQCDLCPKHCKLREGKRGACFIRMHHLGEIVLTSYGRSSGFCIDPIEKKPFNHFYPGSRVMSFGTAGCNLSCQFCQNWDMSKSRKTDTLCNRASPEKIIQSALKNDCQSIAFTYNDPIIFMEYAIDIAIKAKEENINSVAVSAGYVCDKPRRDFFNHINAANIDLKAFTDTFYRKICHAQLQPVLDTLLYLHKETQVWFEITNLLIPGENDSDKELHEMCQWISENLSPNIPLHFSAFHPDFKMLNKDKTPLITLKKARTIAMNYGLNYVYCGNVFDTESDSTYCPHCKNLLIERNWYQINQYNLDNSGHCIYCNNLLSGHFNEFIHPFGARRIPIKIT
ncbi:AmmeMemoRadiSam system radical SAM enzyme [Pseudoalteromonas denitrificans]|uniref:Pyruvate formate lyase activating enzyme n=1 Tax=Pseudoalteromonas denitrificans DSM 6059 TaxID=1123010 RepID=A0A1I1J3S6_9GAMM|nr:AmmeMemoRadiSam system radical SAM enzyme [Pseudoalteromonas denitrificans]SFC43154.1 pyruvate formate lyase activating enzyme [Pseudoalteromonas denitrificans DSM 6059]